MTPWDLRNQAPPKRPAHAQLPRVRAAGPNPALQRDEGESSMTPDFDPDYTLDEVAQILRKRVDTVGRWARAGRLPGAYQVSERGRWSVRRRDFDAWHAGLGPIQAVDDHGIEPPSARSSARRKNAA